MLFNIYTYYKNSLLISSKQRYNYIYRSSLTILKHTFKNKLLHMEENRSWDRMTILKQTKHQLVLVIRAVVCSEP